MVRRADGSVAVAAAALPCNLVGSLAQQRAASIRALEDEEEARNVRKRRASALKAKSWYALIKKDKDFAVLQTLDWTPRQLVAFTNTINNQNKSFKKGQVKKAAEELDRLKVPVRARSGLINSQTCSMEEIDSMGGSTGPSDADLEPGWWKTDVSIKRASPQWDHPWEKERPKWRSKRLWYWQWRLLRVCESKLATKVLLGWCAMDFVRVVSRSIPPPWGSI